MHEKSRLPKHIGTPESAGVEKQAAEARSDGRAAPAGRTEVATGAPPSNTAPGNSIGDAARFLRWGVDSLYLSFKGELHREVDKRLRELKAVAQAKHPHEQAYAQYEIGGHFFEVRDKGSGLFPYIVEDGAFRIQLARPGGRLPMAYVRVSSEYLTHHAPAQAEVELLDLLRTLGEVDSLADVSRVDLFVDFVTDADMEAFGRHAWVTRAEAISSYAVDGVFSGWMIGAGGPLSCRLYNKTLELQVSHKDYLKPLWAAQGWKEGEPVWRLEFQYRRVILAQMGFVSLGSVLGALGAMWCYACREWLRLTIPNDSDATRTRWPLHPLWDRLGWVEWATPSELRQARFSADRAPSEEAVARIAFGALTSFMALGSRWRFWEAWNLFGERVELYCVDQAQRDGQSAEKYLEERVRIKGRKFNTILNEAEISEEDRKRAEIDAYASEYRKRSRG